MSLKLTIDIESPMTRDEAEMLMGISVMTHAIGSRQLEQLGVPVPAPDGEADPEAASAVSLRESSAACGIENRDGTALCTSRAGHGGRHRFPAPAKLD